MKTTGLCLAVLLSASNSFAGFVLWNSLAETQQRAELIAVGSIVTGDQTEGSANFTLRIARVLKGDTSLIGKDVLVQWNLDARQAAGTRAGGNTAPLATSTGLWFLHNQPGAWVVVPVMQGDTRLGQSFISVPAGEINPAYSYTLEAPLEDKLASEISAGH
jgi:hypothetical protein